MTGVLFIINVPQKDHEVFLHNTDSCVFQSKALGLTKKEIHIPIFKYDYNKSGLDKSKSEIILNVEEANDEQRYLKSSWGVIKQILKSKRNKLKITRPVRSIDVLDAFHWDTPLETVSTEMFCQDDAKKMESESRHKPFWEFSMKNLQISFT